MSGFAAVRGIGGRPWLITRLRKVLAGSNPACRTIKVDSQPPPSVSLNMMTPEFKTALDRFVTQAQAILDASYSPDYLDIFKETLAAEPGKRYVRIVRRNHNGENRSAHCFVDMTNGDILKAASWKTPAKHARGNIFSVDHASTSVSAYGAHYLR